MLLKHITIRGHVLQFKTDAMPPPMMGLFAAPERIGVNEASTFFGFCDRHDSRVFRPLESGAFNFTPERVALLGYRAICRESYQKDAEISPTDMLRDAAAVDPDTSDFKEKGQDPPDHETVALKRTRKSCAGAGKLRQHVTSRFKRVASVFRCAIRGASNVPRVNGVYSRMGFQRQATARLAADRTV